MSVIRRLISESQVIHFWNAQQTNGAENIHFDKFGAENACFCGTVFVSGVFREVCGKFSKWAVFKTDFKQFSTAKQLFPTSDDFLKFLPFFAKFGLHRRPKTYSLQDLSRLSCTRMHCSCKILQDLP